MLTPSAVYVEKTGTVLVGTAALAKAATGSNDAITSFKRDMGTERTYRLGGRTMSPVECSALVLAQLKSDVEARLGRPIDEAVVTVPAYFGEDQRRATRDACEVAGLHVERIINEPTAAALAYGLHQKDREFTAVVLDLGGGTFDVTVLEVIEQVIEIQGSAGDARLGGDDFTSLLIEHAKELIARDLGIPLHLNPLETARLKSAVERAKHQLSTADTATITLSEFAGQPLVSVKVSREAAARTWTPLLERMRGPILRALRDAKKLPEHIEEVLLVGGATRMPAVFELAKEVFAREPSRYLPPDEAVAMGAALQAGLKTGDRAVEDLVVTDIAPFTMGIATGARVGTRTVDGLYSPVLERGTVLPASRAESFVTMETNQTKIEVEVFQGEHSLCKDNTRLGRLMVKEIPPALAGEQSVEVRFTYDLNGILEVECTVLSTGKKSQLIIERSGRLSKAQVKDAQKRMNALKFHPREALPNVTALARADKLHVELTGESRQILANVTAEFRAALETQDPKTIEQARGQLNNTIRRLESELS
jgi:molecular chaperone HscC